jgi:hypothetical protein
MMILLQREGFEVIDGIIFGLMLLLSYFIGWFEGGHKR